MISTLLFNHFFQVISSLKRIDKKGQILLLVFKNQCSLSLFFQYFFRSYEPIYLFAFSNVKSGLVVLLKDKR